MTESLNNRTTKRRDKIHQDILNVAAKLIGEKGSAGVTLEEISLHADVARKTVYNHFDNKSALIEELVMPLCEHAKDYLNRLSNHSEVTLDHIWDYCLEIWNSDTLNVTLLYQITVEDFSGIYESKHGFIIVFSKLLKQINEFSGLNGKLITSYAEIIYETYMPLLKCLDNVENYEAKFRKGMTGLIKGVNNYAK